VLQGASGIDSTLVADANGHLIVAGQVRLIAVSDASDGFLAVRGGNVCVSRK